jgi:hypothetical protein
MAEQKPDADDRLKLAGAIAKRVRIDDIRLVNSKVKREVLNDEDIPKTVRLDNGFKVTHRFDAATRHIHVLVLFFVCGRPETGEGEADIFRIESSFSLDYRISGDEPAGVEEVAAFAKLNGIYNAWPYWREYVQSTASRMGLPPLVLPVISPGTIEKMVQADEERTGTPAETKPEHA